MNCGLIETCWYLNCANFGRFFLLLEIITYLLAFFTSPGCFKKLERFTFIPVKEKQSLLYIFRQKVCSRSCAEEIVKGKSVQQKSRLEYIHTWKRISNNWARKESERLSGRALALYSYWSPSFHCFYYSSWVLKKLERLRIIAPPLLKRL